LVAAPSNALYSAAAALGAKQIRHSFAQPTAELEAHIGWPLNEISDRSSGTDGLDRQRQCVTKLKLEHAVERSGEV
jgi:hypothetical protein